MLELIRGHMPGPGVDFPMACLIDLVSSVLVRPLLYLPIPCICGIHIHFDLGLLLLLFF